MSCDLSSASGHYVQNSPVLHVWKPSVSPSPPRSCQLGSTRPGRTCVLRKSQPCLIAILCSSFFSYSPSVWIPRTNFVTLKSMFHPMSVRNLSPCIAFPRASHLRCFHGHPPSNNLWKHYSCHSSLWWPAASSSKQCPPCHSPSICTRSSFHKCWQRLRTSRLPIKKRRMSGRCWSFARQLFYIDGCGSLYWFAAPAPRFELASQQVSVIPSCSLHFVPFHCSSSVCKLSFTQKVLASSGVHGQHLM